MKIFLLDRKQNMVKCRNKYFSTIDNVEVVYDDFENFMDTHDVECVVSPANSFGLMDGGYDLAITKWFGNSDKINNSMSAWVFKTTQGNCKLIATGGNYTFSYNHVLNELSITHTPFTTEEKIERILADLGVK